MLKKAHITLALVKLAWHFLFIIILLHLSGLDWKWPEQRIILSIFSQSVLFVYETGESEKSHGTVLNTCIVCWRAGLHSTLERFVWGKEWERVTLVSGLMLCFSDENSPRNSYMLNIAAAQLIRAHLLQSIPAFASKKDCPHPLLSSEWPSSVQDVKVWAGLCL